MNILQQNGTNGKRKPQTFISEGVRGELDGRKPGDLVIVPDTAKAYRVGRDDRLRLDVKQQRLARQYARARGWQ